MMFIGILTICAVTAGPACDDPDPVKLPGAFATPLECLAAADAFKLPGYVVASKTCRQTEGEDAPPFRNFQ